MLSVALAVGAQLASALLLQGLQAGLERGLARLGADLMVVSKDALVNPVPSLLTGESGQPPLPAGVFARLEQLRGVARAAPQRVLRFANPELCGPTQAELVAFDPARDFSVLSWVEPDHLPRPFGPGDVVVGSRLPYQPGGNFMNFTVWGRLANSGVGTHERGLFLPFDAIPKELLAKGTENLDQPSAVLLRLSPGFSPESVRFAIGSDPSLRVIEGSNAMSGVRQSLMVLLRGILLLTVLMLALAGMMIGVVFSAIVSERQRELGLLTAMGLTRRRLVTLVGLEAAVSSCAGAALGGLLALALLRLAEHTLLYRLAALGVAFDWPGWPALGVTVAASLITSLAVGLGGGMLPAFGLTRRETAELIRNEC